MKRLQQWQTILLAISVFLIPTNLFAKFLVESAYVNGLLADYLLPKLYLSDVIIGLLLVSWGVEKRLGKKQSQKRTTLLPAFWGRHVFIKVVLSLFLLHVFVFRQFLTDKPLASLWYLLKLVEMGAVGWFLVRHRKLLGSHLVQWSLIAALMFQSVLGLWQFQTQSSFFPDYAWLGEPRIPQSLQLARGTFGNLEKILPYGTTSHPNILGGFLAVGLVWLWAEAFQKKQQQLSRVVVALVSLFSLTTLFLTQSVSAWLALGLGILLLSPKTQETVGRFERWIWGGVAAAVFLAPMFLVLLSTILGPSTSLERRIFLNDAALKMFIDHPLVGVGLNNFTTHVESYSTSREVVRFVQPAHHLGLLWLAETGLVGMLAAGLVATLLVARASLRIHLLFGVIILLPIALFDHYLLTQQTGLLLTVYFLCSSRMGTSS